AGIRGMFGDEVDRTTANGTVAKEDWDTVESWASGLPGWTESRPIEWAPIPANTDAIYAWVVILVMIAMLMLMVNIGQRRWRAQGLDLDGKEPLIDDDPSN
ncbi:MAG: hypothetical protein ACI9K5_003703, partial [Gammaproteobacteria bacterium]